MQLSLLQEGVLHALSILCRHHVDARWDVVQRASLTQIVKALEDSDVKVREWSSLSSTACMGVICNKFILMLKVRQAFWLSHAL